MEVHMSKVILLVLVIVMVSSSLCMADDGDLKKAYSYYFQGRMEEAISIMDEYVREHPDARILYFIGYAYYELKDFENARRYFEDAYLIDPEFTPIPPEKYREKG
jgi:tetratricopeptide (TPR) repeat protein